MDASLSVMIIDDDADDRMLFADSVEQVDKNIRCMQAANGHDGFEKLLHAETLPHYVFVDVNMPNMNGFQLLSKIRNNEKLRDVKVIIYTTSSQKSAIETAKSLGANGFYTKPENVPALVDYLTRLLRGHGTELFIEVGLLGALMSFVAAL